MRSASLLLATCAVLVHSLPALPAGLSCEEAYMRVCGQLVSKPEECADCLEANSARLQSSGMGDCTTETQQGLKGSAAYCDLKTATAEKIMEGEQAHLKNLDYATAPFGAKVHSEDDDDAQPKNTQAVDDDDDMQVVPTPAPGPWTGRQGRMALCDEELKLYCGTAPSDLLTHAKVDQCLSCVKSHMARIDKGVATKCKVNDLAVMCDPQMAGKSDMETIACENHARNACGKSIETSSGCNQCMRTHVFQPCSKFQQSYFCFFLTYGSKGPSPKSTAANDDAHLIPPSAGQPVSPPTAPPTQQAPTGPNPSCMYAFGKLCNDEWSRYKSSPTSDNYVGCLGCAKKVGGLHLGCSYNTFTNLCKKDTLPQEQPTCHQWLDQLCLVFAKSSKANCEKCVDQRMGHISLQAQVAMMSCSRQKAKNDYCSWRSDMAAEQRRCVHDILPKACPDTNNPFRCMGCILAAEDNLLQQGCKISNKQATAHCHMDT